jgi:DNA-binding response OmpR family regulator
MQWMPMPDQDLAAPRPNLPILLLERESLLRQATAKFLRRHGYQVLACADLRGCERLLAEGPSPAVVLLGARVLDADTAAVARRLRELVGAPILCVADTFDTVTGDLGLPRGLRFLARPFDLPDMLRAIRSHLRRAGESGAFGRISQEVRLEH